MRSYATMPVELAEVHELLWADVSLLYQRWTTFKALFTDQEVVDILNWNVSGFFQLLQRVLLDDVLLGLARLSDKPKTGSQANLVLRSLLSRLPTTAPELVADAELAIATFEAKAAFAIAIRHKRLAHRDEGVATGSSQALTFRFDNAQIEEALAAAGSVLNLLDSRFEDRQTHFAGFIHSKGAETLVRRLRDAKTWSDEYFKRKLEP